MVLVRSRGTHISGQQRHLHKLPDLQAQVMNQVPWQNVEAPLPNPYNPPRCEWCYRWIYNDDWVGEQRQRLSTYTNGYARYCVEVRYWHIQCLEKEKQTIVRARAGS